jgi:hypothetical protein
MFMFGCDEELAMQGNASVDDCGCAVHTSPLLKICAESLNFDHDRAAGRHGKFENLPPSRHPKREGATMTQKIKILCFMFTEQRARGDGVDLFAF